VDIPLKTIAFQDFVVALKTFALQDFVVALKTHTVWTEATAHTIQTSI
jgi:hypothetical protein